MIFSINTDALPITFCSREICIELRVVLFEPNHLLLHVLHMFNLLLKILVPGKTSILFDEVLHLFARQGTLTSKPLFLKSGVTFKVITIDQTDLLCNKR